MRKSKLVVTTFVTGLLISLSIYGFLNSSIDSHTMIPTGGKPLNLSEFSSIPGANTHNMEVGVFNFTVHGTVQTYTYFFQPMKGDYKVTNTSYIFPIIVFYAIKLNQHLSGIYDNTSILVKDYSVESQQGLPPINFTGVSYDKSGFALDANGEYTYNFLSSPGIHYFYFNFTIVPYANYGPFKVSGSPQLFSFEWNITVG